MLQLRGSFSGVCTEKRRKNIRMEEERLEYKWSLEVGEMPGILFKSYGRHWCEKVEQLNSLILARKEIIPCPRKTVTEESHRGFLWGKAIRGSSKAFSEKKKIPIPSSNNSKSSREGLDMLAIFITMSGLEVRVTSGVQFVLIIDCYLVTVHSYDWPPKSYSFRCSYDCTHILVVKWLTFCVLSNQLAFIALFSVPQWYDWFSTCFTHFCCLFPVSRKMPIGENDCKVHSTTMAFA